MGKACGDPDLTKEALRLVTARAGPQYLDGDVPGVLEVFGEVDRRGTPAPDLLLDQIAIGDGGAESAGDVGHNL